MSAFVDVKSRIASCADSASRNNRPLRVAFLLKKFPVLSETFILNQITGLMDRGHQVAVFSLAPSDDTLHHPSYAAYKLAERTTCLKPPRTLSGRFNGAVATVRRHLFKHPGAVLNALNVFRHGRQSATLHLVNFIRPFLDGYDIIQCHYGDTGLVGAQLKALGVPGKLVTMFHGYDIRLGIEKGGDIYRDLFARGALFLSISDYNTAHLTAFGLPEEKIAKLPCGIDTRLFYSPARKPAAGKPAALLTVGRLVEEKSIDTALKALSELNKLRPELPFHYTLIGDGPLKGELTALSEDLGLEHRVSFLGARSQEAVAAQMAISDIFVLPSRAEALPVCVMEAHAGGLPVVATRVGSMHELVKDGVTGYLVPPEDPQALFRQLERLLSQPDTWTAMGAAGRSHMVDNYDTATLSERLVALYRRTLGP